MYMYICLIISDYRGPWTLSWVAHTDQVTVTAVSHALSEEVLLDSSRLRLSRLVARFLWTLLLRLRGEFSRLDDWSLDRRLSLLRFPCLRTSIWEMSSWPLFALADFTFVHWCWDLRTLLATFCSILPRMFLPGHFSGSVCWVPTASRPVP